MKAVNLIPGDAGRIGGSRRELPQGPAYVVLGLLAIAVLLVTIYVLTGNTISDRKAKLASIQQQVSQLQAEASRLQNYTQFEKLAQQRAATVRQIASSRFDWHAALSDLSKVVPANTSLQSLLGTVAPGVSVAGPGGATGASGSGGTGTLRGDVSAPAFELTGCTKTQDDVARLMSRLRVMNGVTRVTLADSTKQDTAQAGTGVSTSTGSGPAQGCPANAPSFNLVVFYQPLQGAAVLAGQTPAVTGPTTPSTTSTTPSQTPTTPTGTSTVGTTSPSSGSTPVNTTSGGSK